MTQLKLNTKNSYLTKFKEEFILKYGLLKQEVLDKSKLKDRLGTSFYKIGVYTKGGILLNHAKLARSMSGTLPDNVE